jgi:hypothetical protein
MGRNVVVPVSAALLLIAGCEPPPASGTTAEPITTAAHATVLASGQAQPGNLVVDDTYVYWSDAGDAAEDGSILSVPKSGGAVRTLATGQNVPFGVAADGSYVYWTNFDAGGTHGRVMKVARTGGTPTVLADNLAAPRGIFVDAFNVYFLTTSSVSVVSKYGGSVVALAPATCGSTLSGDETSLYWVENCVLFPPAGIVKVSKLGGVPVFLTTLAPGALAVDATNLYFGDGASLEALSKLFGGIAVPLAHQAAGPLAVDASYIYWVAAPAILRTPKLGGATKTLYTDANAQAIAVDAKSVYWLDFGIDDGAVLSLPK